MSQDINWISASGISVALFLLCGAVYVLIGLLTPVLLNRGIGPPILIISNRTDAVVFGRDPKELLESDPALAMLRTILLTIIAGLLVTAGCLVIALAWFGLRGGQAWALAALTLAGIVVLPFWGLVLRPYIQAGVPLALGDLPPFMLVPTSLLLPAVILGWIGLR